MARVQIRLFGKFRVQYHQQIVHDLGASKAQELFCYLLLYRARPHPRETLAGLFWGETSGSQSKRYLRKTLWQIQSALGELGDAVDHSLLRADTEWIQIDPQAELWLDVSAFEAAFASVRGVRGRALDAQAARSVHDAVALYQGDLLDGCYEDWCVYERERLQHIYLAMLDKLMDYCEARQEYEAGLAYGAQILRYDRARERTHRRLMRLRYLAGNRTDALRQYQRCVAALEEELGVPPSQQTIELYEQIRADRLADLAPTLPTCGAMSPPCASILQALHRLAALHMALLELQPQIEEAIRGIAPPQTPTR